MYTPHAGQWIPPTPSTWSLGSPAHYLALIQQLSSSHTGRGWFSWRPAGCAKILLSAWQNSSWLAKMKYFVNLILPTHGTWKMLHY